MHRTSGCLLVAGILTLAGCGEPNAVEGRDGVDGVDGADGAAGATALVDIVEEPAGDNCAYGGQAISTGVDENGNGILDEDEVNDTVYVCNGELGPAGEDGEDGDTALVRIDDVEPSYPCWSGGYEIHVGLDLDGDGVLSDDEITSTNTVCHPLSFPLSPNVAEAFGCPSVFNGNSLVVGDDGTIFIHDFPGNDSTPATLHSLDRDGDFSDGVNTEIPPGTRSFARGPNGEIYAAGSSGGVQRIVELDPADGSTVETIFEEPGSVRVQGLTLDEDGRFYVAEQVSSGPIYQIDGGTMTEYAPGFGNNTYLLFHTIASRLYIGTGGWFGYTVPGASEATVIAPNTSFDLWISGLTKDGQGNIYVGYNCDFDCEWNDEVSSIDRYSADGTESVRLFEIDGGLRGPVYDPEHNELIFAVVNPGSEINRPTGCESAASVYFRLAL